MKALKLLFLLFFFCSIAPVSAQTADEIVDRYFEKIGGKEAWRKLQSFEMHGLSNVQGQSVRSFYYLDKNGIMLSKLAYFGMDLTLDAFNGRTRWGFDYNTLETKIKDIESRENYKMQIAEFPDPLLDYKEKGFKLDLLGKVLQDGNETYKIKLTKHDVKIDDVKKPNISYYYFDTKEYLPIVTETSQFEGPKKGKIQISKLENYTNVEGLYFPFKNTVDGQVLEIEKVLLNTSIDPEELVYKSLDQLIDEY